MSRYCLDTSAYRQFKRGDEPIVDLVDGAEWLGLPSVVIGELWVGFLGGRHHRRNLDELLDFLASPAVEELPVDREVAQIYAEIVRALRLGGTPLPTNDIWIAASAARAGATVVTYDKHFQVIQRAGSLILGPPGSLSGS